MPRSVRSGSDGFPGQPPARLTYTRTTPASALGDGWLCSPDMTHLTAMTAAHATDRLTDWRTALRAENKSPGTVAVYADGAARYLRWCAEQGHLPMSRASLNQWIAGLLDAGAAPGTARIRQLAVRRFASWLTDGGEIHADPFPGIKAPRVEPPMVEPLTDDELRALIRTCAVPETLSGGRGQVEDTLHHRRDEAIIRLMFETAIRSSELVNLQLDDVDLIARLITIRRGKGGRGRIIPIGPATTEALLAYLHERERHSLAATPDLWLGSRGRRFGRDGLSRSLRRRAARAEVKGFRPHRLRHTAAHRWLAAGGSESGLMAIPGWTRTDMLIRYTRARASERAADEARRLDLGAI
jgi:site-specific recombinase XerD